MQCHAAFLHSSSEPQMLQSRAWATTKAWALLQHFLNARVRLKARWPFRLHVWSLNAGQQRAVQLCRVRCWGHKGSAVCLQSRSDNTQNPLLFEAFHRYWRVKLDCMETSQMQQKGHKVGQAFIIDNRWKTHFFYFLFPPTKRVSSIEVLSISSNSQGTRKAIGSPYNCDVTYQCCNDEGLIQTLGGRQWPQESDHTDGIDSQFRGPLLR